MRRLRILIHGINYAPELTGIGKYTGEMAEWLAARGCEVRVVTALPYYPQWQIAKGYHACRYYHEKQEGVEVWRCPVWVPKKPSGFTRLIHLASFGLSSCPILLTMISWRPHVVIAIAPALASTPFSLLTARLSGAKAWLHLQDFEVDAAINLRILPRVQIVTRLLYMLERRLFKLFDVVSTISGRMCRRLKEKGVSPERILFFPNWVDTCRIHPLKHTSNFLKVTLGIPLHDTVVLYSGNMGFKQGIECLLNAARCLQGKKDIHFVLCGDGAARAPLLRSARDLSTVHFLPLQPLNELNELLNMADIHVLPQRANAADLVMPSKLTGILACGGTVIATARRGTGLAEVIGKAGGILVEPENPDLLAKEIEKVSRDSNARLEIGKRARDYAVRYLDKNNTLERFLKELDSVVMDS